ncbi:MAG: DUF1801 domain-containing protein [Candidatus Peribacteraceae bacterium]|nr:DUF1801 domain-containing protein [Candidatus Peribacteraceae bacterium]
MDKKVDEYVEKQETPQKEMCKELRNIIIKTFPKIEEEMKWGVPTYGNGKYYFVALKKHVNLGFAVKDMTKKEMDLFEGKGKLMRHIKFFSLKEIDEKNIVKLLKLVRNGI